MYKAIIFTRQGFISVPQQRNFLVFLGPWSYLQVLLHMRKLLSNVIWRCSARRTFHRSSTGPGSRDQRKRIKFQHKYENNLEVKEKNQRTMDLDPEKSGWKQRTWERMVLVSVKVGTKEPAKFWFQILHQEPASLIIPECVWVPSSLQRF